MKNTAFWLGLGVVVVLLAVFWWPESDGSGIQDDVQPQRSADAGAPDLAIADEDPAEASPLAGAQEGQDNEGRSSALGFDAADGELVFLDADGDRVPIEWAWLFNQGEGKKFSFGLDPALSFMWPEECGSAAAVIAVAVNHAPFFGWVERGEGPIVLNFPRGQTLAGTSRTEGRPRAKPLRLRVRLDSQMPQAGSPLHLLREHFPPDLRHGVDSALAEATAEIPFAGSFMMEGLGEQWHGNISLHTYRYQVQGMEGSKDSPWWNLSLEHSRQDLELLFLEHPRVYGQLIHAEGSSCTHARSIQLGLNGNIHLAQRSPGEAGVFEVFLPEIPTDSVTITVDHASTILELDPITPASDGNLGRITLPESRSLALQVINLAGAGIPEVQYLIEDSRRWGVTDADGRALEQLGSKQKRITFNAEGYRPQIDTIPPAPTDSVTFVLQSDRGYRIHLRPDAAFWKSQGFEAVPRSSMHLPGVTVVLACPDGLQDWLWSSELHYQMLNEFDSYRTQKGRLTQAIAEEGVPPELVARGLDPQGPVNLSVQVGEVVVYDQVLPDLPEAGLIDVDVPLGAASGEELEVLVVGEDGIGIRGANVVVNCQDRRLDGFADAYGLATFVGLPGTEVRVRAGAYGYVSVDLGVLQLPLQEALKVTLIQGHDLEIKVLTADGSPAADAYFYAEIGGSGLRVNHGETSPGVFLLRGVPDQMLQLQVGLGSWRMPYEIDGSLTHTTLELPPYFPVTFTIDASKTQRTSRYFLLVAQGDLQTSAEVIPADNTFRRRPLLLPMGSYRVTLMVSEPGHNAVPAEGFPALDVTVAGGPVHLDFR